METVKLVERFKGTNVAGFDKATGEAGFPIDNHVSAFRYVHEKGICDTYHASEAKGAGSVWETLEYFKPTLIVYGTRSVEDPKPVKHLKKHKIHLEIFPSCNVQISL